MKSDELYHSSILLFYISPTSKNTPILRIPYSTYQAPFLVILESSQSIFKYQPTP